jgi:uncharacterized protein
MLCIQIRIEKKTIYRRVLRAEAFIPRLRGLMFRSSWKKDCDGIFFPNCACVHTCFTFLKPDVVFIDGDGLVLQIVTEARPWGLFLGPRGTRHVLEVSGDTARQNGLRPDMRLVF